MPQKTFYLRNEDIELWRSIKDKAQFISDALHSVNVDSYNKAVVERKEIKKIVEPHLKAMKPIEFCKHNAVKGML